MKKQIQILNLLRQLKIFKARPMKANNLKSNLQTPMKKQKKLLEYLKNLVIFYYKKRDTSKS